MTDEQMAERAVGVGRVDDIGPDDECVYTRADVRLIEKNAAMAGILAERNRRLEQVLNLPISSQKIHSALKYAAFVCIDRRDQLNASARCKEAIPFLEMFEHERCDMIDQLHAQEIAYENELSDAHHKLKVAKDAIKANHDWLTAYGNHEEDYFDRHGHKSSLCITNEKALEEIGVLPCEQETSTGCKDSPAQQPSQPTTI